MGQYGRYLPTLQLKKQQLQLEILHQLAFLEEEKQSEEKKRHAIEAWAGLFTDRSIDIRPWVRPKQVVQDIKNIAGIDIPVFIRVEFPPAEYDFFAAPLWADNAIEAVRSLVSLLEEIRLIEGAIEILRRELKVTTQRVNLFEKVKIPEAEEAIRLIKIYIGDQMTNAVGRSKIAKNKIQAEVREGVAV